MKTGSSACRNLRPLDCHVHLHDMKGITKLARIADGIGFRRVSIVAQSLFSPQGRKAVNENPGAFMAKATYPNLFYVFAALDHTARMSGGRMAGLPLARQVDRLIALGADGIKMIETKPTERKVLDVPVDGRYFAGFFARAEETGFPLLWHVNDPEEFWDPAKVPEWARKAGWFYNGSYVKKETLYAEVEHVLCRHPKLQVIFAHFYFLSADLRRAAAFLDAHPNVHLDLAPGWELFYNMSRDPAATRAFFVTYADRILYGTDIANTQSPATARRLAGDVLRWLATRDVFRKEPGYGVLRGLGLPRSALAKILHGNFERIAGGSPRVLRLDLARDECERIAAETDAMSGCRARKNPARRAAKWLSAKRSGR